MSRESSPTHYYVPDKLCWFRSMLGRHNRSTRTTGNEGIWSVEGTEMRQICYIVLCPGSEQNLYLTLLIVYKLHFCIKNKWYLFHTKSDRKTLCMHVWTYWSLGQAGADGVDMEPEENKAKGRFRMRSASVCANESRSELPPLTEAQVASLLRR